MFLNHFYHYWYCVLEEKHDAIEVKLGAQQVEEHILAVAFIEL